MSDQRRYSIDTRTLKPGDIFIPIKGPHFDGHSFIPEAIKKGASQILDLPIAELAKGYRKKLSCSIVAITGSSGKTTMKDMLHSILSQKYRVAATYQNQNNEIGVPLTILNTDARTDILLLELGMRHKGDIAYLTKIIRPSHVVITTIGKSHYAHFESLAKIADVKGEIFLSPISIDEKRSAYLNYSAPYFEKLSKKARSKDYDVYPFQGESGIDQSINLCYLIGQAFGLTDAEIKKGLANYKGSEHRLTRVTCNDVTVIDDSYNANPEGMRYALAYLKRVSGRKICVLGDMLELGSISRKEHLALKELLLDAGIAQVFTYGDEMRALKSEDLPVLHFTDKLLLNEALLAELKPGDTVLIKGSRGMKMEEVLDYIYANYT